MSQVLVRNMRLWLVKLEEGQAVAAVGKPSLSSLATMHHCLSVLRSPNTAIKCLASRTWLRSSSHHIALSSCQSFPLSRKPCYFASDLTGKDSSHHLLL